MVVSDDTSLRSRDGADRLLCLPVVYSTDAPRVLWMMSGLPELSLAYATQSVKFPELPVASSKIVDQKLENWRSFVVFVDMVPIVLSSAYLWSRCQCPFSSLTVLFVHHLADAVFEEHSLIYSCCLLLTCPFPRINGC